MALLRLFYLVDVFLYQCGVGATISLTGSSASSVARSLLSFERDAESWFWKQPG